MVNISVYLSQSLVPDELTLKDKNVVVVDILRASSTILTALVNGAKEVIPAESVSVAARISKGLGNSILCGERNGKVIEGFKLGNSPFEYSAEKVKSKSLVFSTTNGTIAIAKSKYAKSCVLASFLNFSAVVGHLSALNDDFTIVCSGKLNDFCVEDSVYAGLLIAKLFELNSKSNYTLLDSGYISYQLAKQLIYKNAKPDQHRVFNMFKKSEHGKYLVSLGFEKDLEYCSNIDSFKNLPTFKNNIIKLKETFDSEATEKSKMKRINISNKSGSSKE
ncbi:MAG: 2-phosphosulfolactate phosphatase [Ignavibacteriota bacterium]|nr:2-phosphosulfolactate phosphatase [Ignavibacteriota bacterium]